MAGERIDRYYGIKPQIADELKSYETLYFREDKPVPFCGLLLYPATLHDYEGFLNCVSCLTLNKNEDPKGIRMSNIHYLISKIQSKEEGSEWSYKIQHLFEIIFHIKNGIKCTGCNTVYGYGSPEFAKMISDADKESRESGNKPKLKCPSCGASEDTNFTQMIKIVQDSQSKQYSFVVDGHTIGRDEFNRLRYIVMYQNFSDYQDDAYVDPEIKKDHDAHMELLMKQNDSHATLEKKVVAMSIATHYSFAELFDMTIRKFNMVLTTVDDKIDYECMKQGLMSGMVTLKKGEKPEHWIYKKEKDLYGDAYKDKDALEQEVSTL